MLRQGIFPLVKPQDNADSGGGPGKRPESGGEKSVGGDPRSGTPGTHPSGHDPEYGDGDSEDDPLIGKVVGGNFRIKELLGFGAMGKVYLAEQLSLSKDVAIKVLHKHLAGDEQLARRFHREAKSASLLDHPNSISIIDFGQDIDGSLYIAMEFLQGIDLAEIIAEEFPLPFDRVVKILGQVCLALDEAHHQNIVHRDLKPENVMVMDRRGQPDFVKVCDFGIAKVQDPKGDNPESAITMAGIVCGTPEYMSPEQARGEVLDGRSDVYALGVMLYQMITEHLPFTGETALGIVTKHLTESPVPPRTLRQDLDIHPAVETFILRAMSKDKEQRPQSAAAFKEELERVREILDGTVPYVPDEPDRSTAASATEKGTRRTVAVLSAAVIVVLGLAVALVVYYRSRRPAGSAAPQKQAASRPDAARDGKATRPVSPGRVSPVAADASVQVRASVGPPDAGEARVASRGRKSRKRRRAANGRATQVRRPPVRTGRPSPAEPARKSSFKEVYDEAVKLFKSSRYSAALAKFKQARKLSPGSAKIYKYIGKCYMRKGQTGRAVRAFKRYLRRAPGASDGWVYRGIIKKHEQSRARPRPR